MDGVINGIILGLLIIGFLQITRYFRRVRRSVDDIEVLKRKVAHLEEQLNNQNNKSS